MAQFASIESFETDTIWRKKIKVAKVKQVTENITENGISTFSARYKFAANGKVLEELWPYNNGFLKKVYKYNNKGFCIRGEVFEDTLTLLNWKRWELDAKGRAIKENYGFVKDGIKTEYLTLDAEIRSEQVGRRYTIEKKYSAGVYEIRKLSYDSIFGADTFLIKVELPPPGQGFGPFPKPFTKEVTITRRTDSLRYEFQMHENADSRASEGSYVICFYDRHDRKGRLIEFGRIDYENLQKNGQKSNNSYGGSRMHSPEIVSKIINLQVSGDKRILALNTFDVKGNLIAKKDEEFVSKFYYNEKGHLVKYEYVRFEKPNSMNSLMYGNQEPIDHGVVTYTYNSKGLVTEMQSSFTLIKGEQNTITKTYTYVY
jgi:hypothetical protein